MTEEIEKQPDDAIASDAVPATETPQDTGAPIDGAAEASTAAPADEDLSQLLEEYDQSTVRPFDVDGLLQRDSQAADGELLNSITEREARLEQAAAQARQQQYLQQELAAFKKFCDDAQEGLSDLPHLPKNYAETWLIAEAMRNPDLRAMWDNRNNRALPASTRQQIAMRINGTLGRLYKEAHQLPDPEATSDRDLIVQAVRRGAGERNMPDPPPLYGLMSDREFRSEVKQKHGFDPGI